MRFTRGLCAVALGWLLVMGSAGADPAADRKTYEEAIDAKLKECSRNTADASNLGLTAGEVLDNFARLTSTTDAPCRWAADISDDGVKLAQLVAAAQELLTKESVGCDTMADRWDCAAARTIGRRMDELLVFARNSEAPIALSRYQFSASQKIFGIQGEEVDPIRIVLSAGPPELLTGWPASRTSVSDLKNRLAGAGAPLGAPCPECVVRARKMLLYVIFFDVVDTAKLPISQTRWQSLQVEADRYSGRWEAYHFGGGSARTPLPWELWANGLLYQTINSDRAKREGQLPGTPGRPPQWALVLMHPSIGITPFDNKGSDSSIVGVVEGIGVSHWTYDDATHQRKDEWGISLAGVYQPREDADDWSPGLVLRLPFQGINVVYSRPELASGRRDDVWGFSIDPTKLFGEGGLGDFGCMFGLPSCSN